MGIKHYVYSLFIFVDIRQNFLAEESSSAETCLNTEQYKNSYLFTLRVAQILAV